MNLEELLCGKVRGTAHIRRYSTFPVLRQENIAEHSFFAAYYALQIGRWAHSHGHAVDLGLLARRAVVHDLEEALTSDIPRSFKYATPQLRKEIEAASIPLMHRIAGDTFPDPGEESARDGFIDDWVTAKDTSIEGRILKFVDFACVFAYVREERRCGNHILAGELANVRELMEHKFYDDVALAPLAREIVRLIDEELSRVNGHIPATARRTMV